MADVGDLRNRLVGQRFYDVDQDETFSVVGITPSPPLALLQYDDGVAWDEGASNFTVNEDTASQAMLDPDGLDSDRYRQLLPGPRLELICDPEKHDWFPQPDTIWPAGPPTGVGQGLAVHPHDLYARIVRCRRCGLSGDVARQYGFYQTETDQRHAVPWFCTDCDDVFAGPELVYHADHPFCPDCVPDQNDSEATE